MAGVIVREHLDFLSRTVENTEVMKSIYTLRADIYSLTKEKNWRDKIAPHFKVQLQGSALETPFLRLSQIGPRCPRALWYSINRPELEEPVQPWVQIKFVYGNMVEALAIACAKAAGHEVTGEQDALNVDGVVGHRDCVIDGHVVDVKSSSSKGMDKFRLRTLASSDSFGYLPQLESYLVGSYQDPLVRVKDKGFFLAVSRDMGHMELYEHQFKESEHERIHKRIEECKAIVGASEPPACTCGTELASGGNIKLDVKASYSNYKHSCFPGLRTFIYSGGPQFFTSVRSTPSYRGVPLVEVDRHGNIVYN